MTPNPPDLPAGDNVSDITETRKDDHIRINLREQVSAQTVSSGFERIRFVHNALPELDVEAVDLSTSFLGHTLATPLLVSSMIGGTVQAHRLLRRMAAAAERTGCAIGVGSQRIALENPELAALFAVREEAPTAFLLANIGAVQLNYGVDVSACVRLVKMIEADALILHLNPMQEAVQEEGDRNFAGLQEKIRRVCHEVGVPVIAKEVGFGISANVALRLIEAGVSAIDVGGSGGTSWSAVEGHRSKSPLHRKLGQSFRDWGIPTATSVRMVREAAPQIPLIASGGLHSGIDAAKAIALGADLAGFAGPVIRAAARSEEDATELLELFREQLRLSMFATGSATLADLRNTPLIDEA